MTVIEQLQQMLLEKQEVIELLSSGQMVTFLQGVDVTGATLSQEREEVETIRAALEALSAPGAGDAMLPPRT